MRSFILGTDWWTDCDDAVAIRLFCRYAKAGRASLLGIGINACMPYSVSSLRGYLASEGMASLPLGIDREATDFGGRPPFQKRLTDTLCPDGSNGDAEDAVRLYRRLLAEAEGKVEIVEIGFLQVITALLQSGADDISPESGMTLVREKVEKFWVMAGKWDKDGEKEHNFCLNDRSRKAAKAFCELCPVPVTFLGWEVGFDVITGGAFLGEGDPLYGVLCDHGSANGRSSWDPMLVLLALIGDEEKAGYSTVRGFATVDMETGANHFQEDESGSHVYVVKQKENAFYEKAINEIIAGKK